MNKMTKITAGFNLFVGASMILMWVFFYISDAIPELETAPYDIAMHLIAEFIAAILLILSGIAFIKTYKLQESLYYISYGALMYSIINSSGYFLAPFDIAMTMMFVSLLFVSTGLVIYNTKQIVVSKNKEK